MPNQSTLPAGYEEHTLATLKEGETAYTVPWLMWADEDRKLWITAHAPIWTAPVGPATLRVKREVGAVRVWASTIGAERYKPGKIPATVRPDWQKYAVVLHRGK